MLDCLYLVLVVFQLKPSDLIVQHFLSVMMEDPYILVVVYHNCFLIDYLKKSYIVLEKNGEMIDTCKNCDINN